MQPLIVIILKYLSPVNGYKYTFEKCWDGKLQQIPPDEKNLNI